MPLVIIYIKDHDFLTFLIMYGGGGEIIFSRAPPTKQNNNIHGKEEPQLHTH